MNISKNILLIEPFLPFPSKSGGHVATYNGLKAIHDKFETVFIIFPVKPYRTLQAEIETLQTEMPNLVIMPYMESRYKGTLSERGKKKIKYFLKEKCKKEITRLLESITNSRPSAVKELYAVKDYPNDFQQFIRDTIKAHSISLVQIEFYWFLPIVACIPEDVTKIFVHHELGFARQELYLELEGKNAYGNSGAKICKWFEISLLNQYDAVITLSQIDHRKLIDAGVKVPVYVSRAIVSNKAQSQIQIQTSTTTLSFLGPDTHYPNLDGVMWFLEHCWDKLLKKNHNFHLKIIGNWKKSKIRKIKQQYPQITFTGIVDNLNEALAGTTMIVPIRIGSGIRMKILEAAQLGVPFVTTSVGVEGLPFISGEDCFITNCPDTFVDNIIALENEVLRKEFTQAARKKVDEQFSFQTFKNNRIEIINKVINN